MSNTDAASSAPDVDPYDPELQQCPVPTYHALRAAAPVYHSVPARAYIVSSYELVEAVLRDPVTFSNNCPREEPPTAAVAEEIAGIRRAGWPHVSTLATQDPPLHGEYRAVVTPFFSPAAIRAYESRAREVCDQLLDALDDRPLDFVADVAEPLPIRVTTELMDLDPSMMETYRGWTRDATVAIGNIADDRRRVEAERGLVAMQRYFHERIEQARRWPGSGFFSALVEATVTIDGEERPLSTEEMISLSRQLFVGGIETTTKLLAEAVRFLAENPEHYEALRADPALIARFTEETLRLTSPAQGLQRRTTRDTELGGVTIPKGSTVITMYAAANRDPDVFTSPDGFDPARPNLRRHLAFGKGTHFCLGAPISRMEALVALQGLIARFPRIALVPERNDFAYEPSFILRGLKELWVQFDSSDTAPDQ
jgi:cytochrome P450